MNPANQLSNHGWLSLALALGGSVLAALLGLFLRSSGSDAWIWVWLLFAAFQISALVIGWRFRRDRLGRTGAVVSGILLVLSPGLLS